MFEIVKLCEQQYQVVYFLGSGIRGLIRDNGIVCEPLIHGSFYKIKGVACELACAAYVSVASVKGVVDFGSVVGSKCSQLETLVAFIIVSSVSHSGTNLV